MSYCRFENTARDLDDCLEAIENYPIKELSTSEFSALLDLLRLANELLEYKQEIIEFNNGNKITN